MKRIVLITAVALIAAAAMIVEAQFRQTPKEPADVVPCSEMVARYVSLEDIPAAVDQFSQNGCYSLSLAEGETRFGTRYWTITSPDGE